MRDKVRARVPWRSVVGFVGARHAQIDTASLFLCMLFVFIAGGFGRLTGRDEHSNRVCVAQARDIVGFGGNLYFNY